MNPSNNNNEMQLFNYKEANVRTVMRDGEPWFVAGDVCDVLGLANVSKAIADHVDAMDKSNVSLGLRGSPVNIVNESGLYTLIMRSNKQEARAFQRWVTNEVLPTIRKTGGIYMTDDALEKTLADPDFMIQVLQNLKQVKLERDEAIRTKACISDSKTATAMQTASVLSRRVNNLKKKLGIAENYMQVRAIPWIKEFFGKKPSTGAWIAIGQRMKIIAVEMQEQVIRVQSEKFGEVNAYSNAVVERFKLLLMLDESYLSKWRA